MRSANSIDETPSGSNSIAEESALVRASGGRPAPSKLSVNPPRMAVAICQARDGDMPGSQDNSAAKRVRGFVKVARALSQSSASRVRAFSSANSMMRRLWSRVLAQSIQNGFLCNEADKAGSLEFICISIDEKRRQTDNRSTLNSRLHHHQIWRFAVSTGGD